MTLGYSIHVAPSSNFATDRRPNIRLVFLITASTSHHFCRIRKTVPVVVGVVGVVVMGSVVLLSGVVGTGVAVGAPVVVSGTIAAEISIGFRRRSAARPR